jgi:hypothetical protein
VTQCDTNPKKFKSEKIPNVYFGSAIVHFRTKSNYSTPK